MGRTWKVSGGRHWECSRREGWDQRAAGEVQESPVRANGVADAVADLLVSIAGSRQQPEQRNLVSSWHV